MAGGPSTIVETSEAAICANAIPFYRLKLMLDFQVRAQLQPNSGEDYQNGQCQPCGRKRCQCCKMITHTGAVKSSSAATVNSGITLTAQNK